MVTDRLVTISVAMTTYNGARFLQEQLHSIANQSCLPDELVIVDDRSSDTTRERLESFAASAPFAVNLHFNETTLGPIRNFQRAVELCKFEIIVLCDQDDRWYPEKLFQIKQAFSSYPGTGMVFSDAELIDENGELLHRRLWQYTFEKNHESAIKSGNGYELLLQYDVVTGATMAFRECFRNVVLPFPTDIPLLHDGWIAVIIAAVGGVMALRQPLIEYRVHPQQRLGIRPFSQSSESLNQTFSTIDSGDPSPLSLRSSYYLGQIKKLQTVQQRLNSFSESDDAPTPLQKRIGYVEGLIDHFRARSGLPKGKFRRTPIVLKELLTFRYHRYSKGCLSAIRDLTI